MTPLAYQKPIFMRCQKSRFFGGPEGVVKLWTPIFGSNGLVTHIIKKSLPFESHK